MWSVPPADPPPQEIEVGSAFEGGDEIVKRLIRESAVTTITSYSAVKREIAWCRRG